MAELPIFVTVTAAFVAATAAAADHDDEEEDKLLQTAIALSIGESSSEQNGRVASKQCTFCHPHHG